MRETMNSFGRTKNKITKHESGENVPLLEITKVVLVHCTIADNEYQHDSRVLYTFVRNKQFDKLLHISSKFLIFQKPLS